FVGRANGVKTLERCGFAPDRPGRRHARKKLQRTEGTKWTCRAIRGRANGVKTLERCGFAPERPGRRHARKKVSPNRGEKDSRGRIVTGAPGGHDACACLKVCPTVIRRGCLQHFNSRASAITGETRPSVPQRGRLRPVINTLRDSDPSPRATRGGCSRPTLRAWLRGSAGRCVRRARRGRDRSSRTRREPR